MINLPDSMYAIEISTPGDASVLVKNKRNLPIPEPDEVLIQVRYAGINRPDIMQRKGLYPPPPGASDIPGLEVSGTIVKLGCSVNNLNIGDSVCALTTGGGYAEYCKAPAALCLPIPHNLSLAQAAALPETFFTVWNNVFDRADLKPNETLLIHGGSSGIGTTAIQLGKAFGSHVIITAGNEHKCKFCQQLGADLTINYTKQDFVEEIKQFTSNNGVDVILDMIGGAYFPRNIKCLANEGRLVQIAIQKGAKAEINLISLMLKRITLTGSTLRARNTEFKKNIAKQLLEKVWPLLECKRIKPVIDSTYPLTKAFEAHQRMESSHHIGKILLKI